MTDRPREIAEELIERLGLDLRGLRVFTEAASGPYLHTPLIAALAGADRVFAVTADSGYASGAEVAEQTAREAERWSVAERLEIGFERAADRVGESDIVTNSGFVRPIDADLVARLKPTAVVPLMWETWEHRPEEVDLEACRARDILVLGTNESRPPCDMRPHVGALGPALLRELGLRGPGLRIALLGAQPLIGGSIHTALTEGGHEVLWFGFEHDGARPYQRLREEVGAAAADLDAILVAEHQDPRPLLGEGGELDPLALAAANPRLRIGVVAGNVDPDALRRSGLQFSPGRIRPFGEMSFQPADLGPEPVLLLYAAGLRVGEAMARARLEGASPQEAARRALSSSPAMDFPGRLAWA